MPDRDRPPRAPATRPHLTYCTNVHPGETWAEVRDNLARYVVPVRERFSPGAPFGLGLRLSAEAARTLADPVALDELRAFLRAHALYIFTINGFPYGPFHGQPVKARVYLPDWLDPARLAYTNQLADVLAALLPDDVEGTISTLPGAFAVGGPDDAGRIAAAMAAHVAHLVRVRATTGRRIALAIEPEPCCFLETVAQTVEFFTRHLFAPGAVAALAREAGLTPAAAAAALREHVGVCFDACHMAVEFEEPAAALAAFARAGIRIAKVQVSAGLRVPLVGGDPAAVAALAAFAEGVYLHQVVERRGDGAIVRYLDLPQALAAGDPTRTGAREWRIHFHVPLFRERLGHFESTHAYVRDLLQLMCDRPAQAGPVCDQFEVETYTWDVLPEQFRGEDIVTAVVRELDWTAGQLRRERSPAGAPG